MGHLSCPCEKLSPCSQLGGGFCWPLLENIGRALANAQALRMALESQPVATSSQPTNGRASRRQRHSPITSYGSIRNGALACAGITKRPRPRRMSTDGFLRNGNAPLENGARQPCQRFVAKASNGRSPTYGTKDPAVGGSLGLSALPAAF
jgi:hypothetical protein